jgi:hypothetical protein
MGAMVEKAMDELDRMNIDIARLGGLRSRYNRYGFEACGQNFTFTFTEKNRLRKFPAFKGGITFKQITPEDKEALAFTEFSATSKIFKDSSFIRPLLSGSERDFF